MTPASRPAPRPGRARHLVWLTALWALLFLPHLGTPELHLEEGRRFLPARAMLATGDHVLPTIFERPYLSKPPLHYWAIELCSLPGGEVTTLTTRLPSALATLGVALLVFLLADRHLSRRAGICAALSWFVTPLAVEKAILGEIEAPLTLFVALALAALFRAGRLRSAESTEPGGSGGSARLVATLGGGVALGAAVLTKGPAAWVFVAAALLGALAFDSRAVRGLFVPALAMIAISAAIGGAWVLALVQHLGWDELRSVWGDQMVGGKQSVAKLLQTRASYLVGTVGGLLPGALLAFALLPRSTRRDGMPPLVRFGLATACGAVLFFLVYPRAEARYVFPAAPLVAIVGGYVLARGIDGAAARSSFGRAWRFAAIGVGAAGCVAGLVCLLDGFTTRIAPVGLDATAVVLLLAMAGAGASAVALARRGSAVPALLAAFGVLASVRVIHAVVVIPHDAHEARGGDNAAIAAGIEAALPPGDVVHTLLWGGFNAMALVPRRVVFVESADDVPAGAPVLYGVRPGREIPAGVADRPRLGAWDVDGWTLIAAGAPR